MGFIVMDAIIRVPPAVVVQPQTFVSGNVNISADTITITAHGLLTGFKLNLTTSGTLPGGLNLGSDYFIIYVDANTIKVASSLLGALLGIAINITSVGSGLQTLLTL